MSVQKVFDLIKENEVEYVDFRFTDTRGKWQHTAQHVSTVDEDLFADGIMFDGSSIAGWKDINESDMVLMPDPATAVMDPFALRPQLIISCDIYDPITGTPYERDPRSIAKRGLAYMAEQGVGDTAYFGPEAEFFMFDNVQFATDPQNTFYKFDDIEGAYNTDKEIEGGNLAHRPRTKGGYFPVNPVDSGVDIRADMCSVATEMGIAMEKHHHEVAPSQHELGMKFNTLVEIADELQIYKYVVHNVAQTYGKTATFMPKPKYGDNGSGMHVHQSIWKDGVNTFAGDKYAGLSETCLYYIGGIIKHAPALNAFTNASTNSYKRLVAGFEAPVLLAYSARNRSASCRIPYSGNANGKRVEVRFPDATANPYLCYTALLMAGLDGIKNKIHPGEPMDKDLYELPEDELAKIPTVASSLRNALKALDNDRDFLTAGDVFVDDFIDSYIALKMEEVERFEMVPHPVEFDLYYSV